MLADCFRSWQKLYVTFLGHFCGLTITIGVKTRFFFMIHFFEVKALLWQKKNFWWRRKVFTDLLWSDGGTRITFILLLVKKLPVFLFLFTACWAIRLYSISGLIKLCNLNKCKQKVQYFYFFGVKVALFNLSYLHIVTFYGMSAKDKRKICVKSRIYNKLIKISSWGF